MTGDEIDEGMTAEQPMEEGQLRGAEFAPEAPSKPKPDVYTVMLIVAFVAFLTGVLITATELHEFYDVQFWVFSKK